VYSSVKPLRINHLKRHLKFLLYIPPVSIYECIFNESEAARGHWHVSGAVRTPRLTFAVGVRRSVPTAPVQVDGGIQTEFGKRAGKSRQITGLLVAECRSAIDQSPVENRLDLHPSPPISQSRAVRAASNSHASRLQRFNVRHSTRRRLRVVLSQRNVGVLCDCLRPGTNVKFFVNAPDVSAHRRQADIE